MQDDFSHQFGRPVIIFYSDYKTAFITTLQEGSWLLRGVILLFERILASFALKCGQIK